MRTSTLAIWAVAFGVAVISTLILMTGSQPRQPTLWSEIFILLPYLFAIMVSGNPHGPSEAAAWVALVVELTLILRGPVARAARGREGPGSPSPIGGTRDITRCVPPRDELA